ncbi:hypothetical protein [Streptococcus suis]|uniref:hypothetical protein n=1 Tax=Streptococcus suis TaxID=1307 RepID=UPI00211C3E02|nr:hypothetical protein [Streptococcus suis]UUM23834.1 hypothetical protein NQZ84_02520 [Streptococcus suis]
MIAIIVRFQAWRAKASASSLGFRNEGESIVPGDSGLGGRNHSPLPGNEGESVVPGDSGLGGRNHSPLPGNEGDTVVPGIPA